MIRPARQLAPLLLLAPVLIGLFACSRRIDPAYVKSIDDWHAKRIKTLRGETGWLTLVGLVPLHPGANGVGSAAGSDAQLPEKAPAHVGTVTVDAGRFFFRAVPGVDVRVENRAGVPSAAAVDTVTMLSDTQGDGPTTLDVGSLLFYVIARGDKTFLRVKDRMSEVRRAFTGIDRFPVDPRWRVVAKFERHDPPLTVAVPDVLGQINEEPSPGTLSFTLAGRDCRLIPTGEPGGQLFIVFGDPTNGVTTYGAGRFLNADAPSPDGKVVLDFNKATNPPCAFTPYATCPLPPEGNRLPVAVEAGEKSWGAGHH
jgi:uncharacterized protein (DUF1684 family)